MRANDRVIDHAYELIQEMVHSGVHIPPAGEWLLDNYYVIKEHITLAREHLPRHFSRELPALEGGPAADMPRIYHLTTELIAHVDGRVDVDNLSSFIRGYQHNAELTIGELWAIPIMLRLALIENLRRVAQRVCFARNDCVLAASWADRLVFMAEKDPKNLVLVLADMVNAKLPSSSSFVAELCRRLQGQSPALALALSWFEQRLAEQGVSSEQLILSDSQGQASDQVSIGNTITSLRLLSAADWREFVEKHSLMDKILRDDPAGVYARMDFETRDAYRHVIERIAKRSKSNECLVARRVIAQAQAAADAGDKKMSHIGFYLLEKGVKQLESHFKVKLHWARPAVSMHPRWRLVGFLSTLLIFTALLTAPVAYGLWRAGVAMEILAPLTALFAFCATQPALHLLNALVTWLIEPKRLPQMDFSGGIPAEFRTIVAVPTMLGSRRVVDHLVEGLETRYLANRDDNLFFALLTDFPDADKEALPEDAELVEHARQSVAELNKNYSSDRPCIFYLFHRPRKWNPREGVWMGIERKRGKLSEFNRVLRGSGEENFAVIEGDRSLLKSFHYVIPLDTDTQLPANSARRLVGAMAHMLNYPVIDPKLGRVVSGYGLLQPRVGLNLSSARRSWFVRIFASDAGIDPYTRAVSDVYQDLFGEGSFVGKGIYDIDAFEQTCGRRFPANRILSHDLIEGCHARSGLLTDVELFEDYPSRFFADAQRRHRWMRGDWQIARWLLPWVPASDGKSTRNTLSILSRWKIFDNLRRSMVAPVALIALVAAWLLTPHAAWVVSAGLALLAMIPAIQTFLNTLLGTRPGVPLSLHLRDMCKNSMRAFTVSLFTLAFLLFEAILSVDATLRTLWRLTFSKRRLLEWQTASEAESKSATALGGVVREMRRTVILALALGVAIYFVAPSALPAAAPWLVVWLLSPIVAWSISLQRIGEAQALNTDDTLFLREVARRTWQFFMDYVTPEENWLPPDNFQQTPTPMIAPRTSTTNMGVGLLSTVSAFDFGYISLKTMLFRLHATLKTMASLPRYQGHLLNWYNTRSLQPLYPQYVSSVDSGNLLGHLLTLQGGLSELPRARLLPDAQAGFDGLSDTIRCLERAIGKTANEDTQFLEGAKKLHALAGAPAATLAARIKALENFSKEAAEFRNSLNATHPNSEMLKWAEALVVQADDLHANALQFAPWLAHETVPTWLSGDERFQRFERACSLQAAVDLESAFAELSKNVGAEQQSDLATWQEEIRSGAENARQALEEMNAISKICSELSAMKFDFLYDKTRKLLAIGYNASEHRLDHSFYDLLASEARVASYLCIALGQLPTKHWFMLGRKLTTVDGEAALLSWSGSMFEYLMPSLIMPCYEGSLLDQTNKAVVKWQIDYARSNGIPWGISESGFNARDMSKNYQYRAFGVPGLGFKRGLSEDLVIAPYACVMSVQVAPKAACDNLRVLEKLGALDVHGFFEAIDYTPSRLMSGQKFAIVQQFMAHHQGMSILALGERLLGDPMRRRFMRDPRLKAVDLLLQERVPSSATPIYPHSAEEEHLEKKAETAGVPLRTFTTANTQMPEVQLLSNGNYHVLLTNSGSGYSRRRELAVTRWREDGTCDHWGQFCYLRDATSGKLWAATAQPGVGEPEDYLVQYQHSSAEFRRHENGITSHLYVCVSPEDDAEIRQLKLVNTTRYVRRIEVVTYAEVVLNTPAADMAHPAFSNLFVQTELVPEKHAILCTRRPRAEHDPVVWMFHQMTVKGHVEDGISFETDRAKFIGRGNSLKNPQALRSGMPLSNSAGSVLDPIVSVRRVIELEPSQSVEVEIVTGIADSKQAVLSLLDKFSDHRLCERAFEVAWTNSKVIMSQLNASEQDAQTFCEMAAPILFASQAHRAPAPTLARNQRGQPGLWGYGISGDNPIVLLRLGDVTGLDLVREALKAHAFLRMKGLVFDLVIWNEDASTYRQVLQDDLMGLVLTGSEAGTLDRPGGVFIRRGDLIAEEDRILLQALARVSLQEGRGRLAEQIDRRVFDEVRPPMFVPTRFVPPPLKPRQIPQPEGLKFFNGVGGFANDGREYVMLLKAGRNTPMPWCNVIANAMLGTVVSESGGAYTFAENAHEYRLTPWFNDALTDPSGECFYLRDEEIGAVWSPTPKPMRGENDYVVRHGFGYSVFQTLQNGIRSEMTVFVAPDAPVKIVLLKVKNESGERRRLSATGYWEWVLGENRSKNAQHVITEFDNRSSAIFARNAYNSDFQQRVSFCLTSDRSRGVTCDRLEFLGRNGSYDGPAALRRRRLSGRVGAGFDPCTALQVRIELHPGDEKIVSFVLGSGNHASDAQTLALQYQSVDSAQRALERVHQNWKRSLNTLQVETPDPAIDALANGWLVYQVLSSRVWARSGFYQSGGAYGFRDQLQDVMALTYAAPELTREHLIRCAGRQFQEGDVQHWWHPPQGRGVRTKFSDDYLWLPYATARYVLTTGDTGVLSEGGTFLNGRALKPEEEAYYDLPHQTDKFGSLFEHCKRALDHALSKMGKHGLPLMGCGDWNDGMNLVGIHGEGESVWLAFFLHDVLVQFAALARRMSDNELADRYEDSARTLRENIAKHAWDGRWYLRAFFDDGRPLGSASNPECQIDALPQSWAVLSKAGDPERCRQAMEAVDGRLVRREKRLIQLFDPPFDKSDLNPGYIKAYVPGVRENGGQYTHAAIWTVMAFAEMGEVDRAWELLNMLNPVHHGGTPNEIGVYKAEPYVAAADVYGVEPHIGRGGWTWYTGSAGWMYRLIVESLLGISRDVNVLHIRPRVPKSWKSFTVRYRFRETNYKIIVERTSGEPAASVDGTAQRDIDCIQLVDDGKEHSAVIRFNDEKQASSRENVHAELEMEHA